VSSLHHLSILFLSLATSFALYANSIKGEFVFDDVFFYPRQELRDWKYLPRLFLEPAARPTSPKDAEIYRPLANVTFSLNFILFGESTTSFHLVTIVLNGIVTYLIFLTTYKMFNNFTLSVISTALFAFFPIHTENVAAIKPRDEILSTMFALSGWLALFKFTRTNRMLWVVASAFLFSLGFFCKEFSLVYPFLTLTALAFTRKISRPQSIKFLACLTPGMTIFIALWIHVLGRNIITNLHTFPSNPIAYASLPTRVWTAGKIAFVYISKTFFPVNLSATYRYNHLPLVTNPLRSPASFIGLTLLAALGLLAIHPRTRSTPLGIGSLIMLISYFPFSKFLSVKGEYVAERWMYFPSIGLAAIGAYLLSLLFQRSKITTAAILILVLAIYSRTTFARNHVWLSDKALYTSMTEDAPDAMFGHLSLGRYYLAKNDYELARPHVLRAMEIYSNHPDVLDAYAGLMFHDKNYSEAKIAIEQSISIYPAPAQSHYFYALILAKMGRYQASLDITFDRLTPSISRPEIRFLTAVNYYRLNQPIEAEKYFDFNPKLPYAEKIRAISEF